MITYQLTVTPEHLKMIEDALEIMSRAMLGQDKIIAEILAFDNVASKNDVVSTMAKIRNKRWIDSGRESYGCVEEYYTNIGSLPSIEVERIEE